MKLAVSNIAWDATENEIIVPILKKYGVEGIEIAPTKRWEEPIGATTEEIENYKQYWLDNGFVPIAMQSLLFNKSHLTVFGETQKETYQYLLSILRLASKLGIKSVVFGSPKNRLIGDLDRQTSYDHAVDFFRILGEDAIELGVQMCIEPNPKKYGCDFITTTIEGLEFVKAVGNNGIRLHIDTGTMILNNENPEVILPQCLPYAGHLHISDPFLNIPGSYNNMHEVISSVLQEINYSSWVSIEMKNGILPLNSTSVTEALEFVTHHYKVGNREWG